LDGEFAIQITFENGEQWAVPKDIGNRHYQEYLKWLAEGNEPLPADE
jgi:hypothetical protein